jgi:hypothetical protein
MYRKDNHRYFEFLTQPRVDPATPSPTWRPRRLDMLTPFAARPLASVCPPPPTPPARPPPAGPPAWLALALLAAAGAALRAHSQKLTST